ncbi:hypothetical protein DFP73DRAFT_535953 [Morchella snyderi]|nr:hypothetical protein DFP73DRAFT_535953 [Morchella snyderi]
MNCLALLIVQVVGSCLVNLFPYLRLSEVPRWSASLLALSLLRLVTDCLARRPWAQSVDQWISCRQAASHPYNTQEFMYSVDVSTYTHIKRTFSEFSKCYWT